MNEFQQRLSDWKKKIPGFRPVSDDTKDVWKNDIKNAQAVLELRGSKHWSTVTSVLKAVQNKAYTKLLNPAVSKDEAMRLTHDLQYVQEIYKVFEEIVVRGENAQAQLKKIEER